ncbi:hypothetical protein HDU98_008697 [Podochytrium sp. JEL0797]|nr:hypothetical protein HDU98_008697 [Podochytrium sp. JEL0797]
MQVTINIDTPPPTTARPATPTSRRPTFLQRPQSGSAAPTPRRPSTQIPSRPSLNPSTPGLLPTPQRTTGGSFAPSSILAARRTSTRPTGPTTSAPQETFRPITLEDIHVALSLLSSDGGKRVTNSDIRRFLEKYFSPTLIPGGEPVAVVAPKLAKVVVPPPPVMVGGVQQQQGGKEECVTKEQLQSLLIGKPCDYFEDALQLVDLDHPEMFSDASIYRLLRCMDTQYGMPRRGDMAAILDRFDRDKDGVIGKEDFKRMNMHQAKH